MSRLIDADEYEKRIKPYDTEDVMDKALYNFAHEKLITIPTAQPEQRWIPTSERLPEDEQPIIFSTKTGRVHQGKYHKDDSVNQWYSALDKMRAWNNVVNAWMPLPEPYQEGEQDE